MEKFSKFIVKNKIIILMVGVLLLIPAVIGIIKTNINYDILVYLPDDIETMKGQKILTDDFSLGSFAVSIIDDMDAKEVIDYENKLKQIDGVNRVVSLYDVIGTEIPIEMLPSEVREKVAIGDSSLMLTTFSNSISNNKTLEAIKEIRNISGSKVKVGGMSAMVLDTKELSDKEITTYAVIATICCLIVLSVALDSYLVPVILLANIGIAILYNMGSNIILGDISYITKALSSILQLGVTIDFSIFLYHQYQYEKTRRETNEEAMSFSIRKTLSSIIGSSTTTMAGFLALCAMQLTLGKDIGIVMAKGVLIGVLTVITIFPSLILFFDKVITKTSHKPLIPSFNKLNNFIIKRYKWIFIIFILLIVPAWWGNKKVEVYYNLDKTLPSTLSSSIANSELEEKYNLVSPMIILSSKDLSKNETNEMINKINELKNISFVLSPTELSNLNIPTELINKELSKTFETDKYNLIVVDSNYQKATEELNNQIDDINKIVKSYSKKNIVAGEGALTKDLVEISNTDFKNVNYFSIIVIFIIIFFVLKSFSLPIILILTIEFAIFLNMGISYYSGITIPFISSIVIGTIQLGATIDYAILMTNKYIHKRSQDKDKYEAIQYSLNNSASSIFISGMCFFAATFGVGVYSKLELVSSLCNLIARGAVISMIIVIFVLPSLLLLFDSIIIKTTKSFKKGKIKMKKFSTLCLILTMLFIPSTVLALTKEETVYVEMDSKGSIKNQIVSEHIINEKNENILKDFSNLTEIINTNGKETYQLDGNSLTWNANGKDIYYKGLTNKKLPISLKINYYLDDELIEDISSINNKSGHIKIKIEYKNEDKHGNLYTPFTVLLATSLNNETNRNIKAINGSVVSNGTLSIIAGIAMPGLSDSLNIDQLSTLNNITIEYDTTNFNSIEIYNLITPKFIDISELSTNLNSLYNQMNQFKSASNQLKEGSKTLYNGLNTLNSNYKDFNNGIKKLNSGTKLLYSNYSKIDDGINEINNMVEKLTPLIDNLQEINSSIQKLNDYVQNIDDNNLNNELDILKSAIEKYETNLKNSINNIITNVCDINNEQYNEKTCTDIKEVLTIINQNELTNKTFNNLKEKINNISSEDIKNNINSIALKSEDITNKIYTAKDNINLLKNGSKLFNTNLGYVSNSINTLSKYSNQIYNGTTELTKGSKQLSEGIAKFDEEGINKIYNLVNNTLKHRVDNVNKLNDLSKNYTSLTDTNKNTNSNTKFIIKIDKNA